ncbi:hypothetical protein [Roseomonas sp. WA12]
MSSSQNSQKHILDLELLVLQAVRKVMGEVAAENQVKALLNLRAELEFCLHEALMSGGVVDAMNIRAELAAAFDKALRSIQDGS